MARSVAHELCNWHGRLEPLQRQYRRPGVIELGILDDQAVQDGVRMAEFLLLCTTRDDQAALVWIVEAKQSSPKPESQCDFK